MHSHTATRRALTALPLLALAGLITGCVHGPKALRVSHAGQNEAIQARINEQLLLNLVRLKYRDNPLFLKIGNVVVQFEFRATAGGELTINEGAPDSLLLPGSLTAAEQPTFTFTPMQDNEFVQRMLRPIDIHTIGLLQRSGWSFDRVLRMTVQRLNGLDNFTSASGVTPGVTAEYEAFATVSRALRTLQMNGGMAVGYEERETDLSGDVPASTVSGSDLVEAAKEGYRFVTSDDGRSVRLTGPKRTLTLMLSTDGPAETPAKEVIDLLGLDPGAPRYEVTPATSDLPAVLGAPGTRRNILLATRSLLGVMYYLSQAIEVPAGHVDRGLVTVTLDDAGRPFDWLRVTGDLMRVHSSTERPSGAAVAVRYRSHWFSIDDADLESKSTFGLLLQLFALQSGSQPEMSPVLTLPVGR